MMTLRSNVETSNGREIAGMEPPKTIQFETQNTAMSGYVDIDLEQTKDGIECNWDPNDAAVGIFENRESFWIKFSENRDEHSDERESDEFDDYNYGKRQEIDTGFPKATSIAHEIPNQILTDHSKQTILEKWESIIRANHGVETFGKPFEFDENDEPRSRLHRSRPVGVLTNSSLKSTPLVSRRTTALDDITNNLNTPSSTTQILRSDEVGMTSQSSTKEVIKPKRFFDRHNVTPIVTHPSPKDDTNDKNVSDPARVRRSFGLSDFVEGLNTPSATRNNQEDGKLDTKITLRDSVRGTDNENAASDSAISNTHDSTVKNIVNSKSTDKKFEKLLGIWNNRIEEDHCSNKLQSHSPSPRKNPEEEKLRCVVDSGHQKRSKSVQINEKPIRALVILEHPNKCDLLVGEAQRSYEGEDLLVIQNVNMKTNGVECECSKSVFSGKEDLISFFLPQMGMACACGRKRNRIINPDDPTLLENILRPWQVEFLTSLGIKRGEELVKAKHRSGDIMARAMRQWRKKYGMTSFKTSACVTALHIWSKICKSYVRSIRRQIQAGNDNFEYGPPDGVLFSEMSQFLVDLPAAPKRRNETAKGSGDYEPNSQVEV
mmetsp:Transcript_26384/g.72508  ORF Transcript_26384/g.72508 Transcript_26384/m.72508 type:complete len:603 (-) Transcript_26384:88-1896(-)